MRGKLFAWIVVIGVASGIQTGCASKLIGPGSPHAGKASPRSASSISLGATTPGAVADQEPRLRSAWLLRARGETQQSVPVPAEEERARLRRHFEAVEEILREQSDESLAVALER